MANHVISMQMLRTIIQLKERGLSGRAIARELKISRQTVMDYLQKIAAVSIDFSLLRDMEGGQLASLILGKHLLAINFIGLDISSVISVTFSRMDSATFRK